MKEQQIQKEQKVWGYGLYFNYLWSKFFGIAVFSIFISDCFCILDLMGLLSKFPLLEFLSSLGKNNKQTQRNKDDVFSCSVLSGICLHWWWGSLF